MRSWRTLLGLALTLLLAACGGSGGTSPSPTPSPTPRPNIIFILTDDLDGLTFAAMPRLGTLLTASGLTFRNNIINVPLCGPSRASILTGQYTHNHDVESNGLPRGGFEIFQERGLEPLSLGPWMKGAGYRTVLFGKYINNYPAGMDTYVPPGWDEWYGVLDDRPAPEFDYSVNENGTVVVYGSQPQDFQTDMFARKATDFIRRSQPPYFMYLGISPPHAPATPAPRYENAFPGAGAPRTASFNEADISDKPAWLRAVPLLTSQDIAGIDDLARHRLQSMLAVEDLLQDVVQALTAAGQLQNTYIFFTSDNGIFQGQHRLPGGKNAPYEESIRVPFVVRGPGVPAGAAVDHVVGNVDYAATFLALAGAPVPAGIDGLSLQPLLGGSPPSVASWRPEYEIEGFGTGAPFPIPPFAGLRTPRYTYVEYATGDRELYDLQTDPDQMQNAIGSADPVLVQQLAGRLAVLRACRGATCRTP
jgi:arylsulfatase A-like enzyme